MEITLDMLLASRESRQAKQMALQSAHPSHTLVCLTVIMPGAVKRNLHSLIVANAALTAYLVVNLDALTAKELTCNIEDTHPLGRLFDLDVLGGDGAPLSRTTVGRAPRQCLLCEHESRWCMRNHTHTQAELHERISQMIEEYVR